MYSNKNLNSSYLNSALISAALLLFGGYSSAEEVAGLPTLIIKPTQCVSLRQGQKCFVNVDLSWQVAKKGDYCLYSTQQEIAIQCWSHSNIGHFKQELVVEENVTFTLKGQNDNRAIVSSLLELAWVHKAQRLSHSSWRVF